MAMDEEGVQKTLGELLSANKATQANLDKIAQQFPIQPPNLADAIPTFTDLEEGGLTLPSPEEAEPGQVLVIGEGGMPEWAEAGSGAITPPMPYTYHAGYEASGSDGLVEFNNAEPWKATKFRLSNIDAAGNGTGELLSRLTQQYWREPVGYMVMTNASGTVYLSWKITSLGPSETVGGAHPMAGYNIEVFNRRGAPAEGEAVYLYFLPVASTPALYHGQAQCEFPGGSQTSSVLEVSNPSGDSAAHVTVGVRTSQIYVVACTLVSANNLRFTARTVDGSSPGAGTKVLFHYAVMTN